MPRTVIVTGGGTGIGRAIAARFAADGEHVIITGRRPVPLQETAAALGPAIRPIGCDATDPAQITAALADRLAPEGTVINFSSIAADKGAGSYGAAKAAIASWTVDLARELGPRGITANVVAPGYIAGTEFFQGRLTTERERLLVDATFTGRAGTPEDIAAAVHFLASPGARHITGQVIAVNGGAVTTR